MLYLAWSTVIPFNYQVIVPLPPYLSQHLSAVHRTLIDASRTVVVWMIELFLYYAVNDKDIGEAWTSYSPLQLGGFIVLLFGTLLYNGVIKFEALNRDVPCLTRAQFPEKSGAYTPNDAS